MMQGLITSIDGHPQSSGATRHDANGRRGHVLVQMQPSRAYSLEVGKSGRRNQVWAAIAIRKAASFVRRADMPCLLT
jgi:hypothetical protein